jgi:hypothetical protein
LTISTIPITDREKAIFAHDEETKKAINGLRRASLQIAAECSTLRANHTDKLTFKELINQIVWPQQYVPPIVLSHEEI